MNKLILALIFSVIPSIHTFAQTYDEYRKNEFFVGYSLGLIGGGMPYVNSDYPDFNHHHGFNVSLVRNTSRYIGAKIDISGVYNFSGRTFKGPMEVSVYKTRNMLHNFLGGVQFKDNASEGRFKPFAHALLGVGHIRNVPRIGSGACAPVKACPDIYIDTGLAVAFGVGLDVHREGKVTIRAFQIDYTHVKYNNAVKPQIRFGTGIVF